MTALFIYLVVALGFSFLCSIAEAVLLSVTVAYISLQDQQGKRGAKLLRQLKSDVDKPLAAILSLNTIAHTVGAAGVGLLAAGAAAAPAQKALEKRLTICQKRPT